MDDGDLRWPLLGVKKGKKKVKSPSTKLNAAERGGRS